MFRNSTCARDARAFGDTEHMAPEDQMKGTYRSSSPDRELHLGVRPATSIAPSTGGHGDISSQRELGMESMHWVANVMFGENFSRRIFLEAF